MRLATCILCVILLQQCSVGLAENHRPRRLGAPPTEAVEKQLAAPTDKTLPKTVAWILFGSMAMIMAVFYLVSYNDKDIVDGTWLVISNAVSLFCAVLLFLSFRDLIALITDGEEVRRLGPASDGDW